MTNTTRRAVMKAAFLGSLAVATLTAAMPGSAGAVTLADIQGRGTVKIGVLTGAPPMGMIDERGNPSGYDVDVANQIGQYL